MFSISKKMSPETFATLLAVSLGDNLQAAILYGSAAASDHLGKQSDFNLLLILRKMGLEELSALSAPVGKWARSGNPAPLLFTEDRLRKSSDVFPIELMDIMQCHRVLHGENVLEGLTVSKQNLRHQVEFELRSKLMKLREGFVASNGKAAILQAMLRASISPVLVVMRAALRLYTEDVPASKMEALHSLSGTVSFDVKPFERLYDMKAGRISIPKYGLPGLCADYIRQIELVTDAVDAL